MMKKGSQLYFLSAAMISCVSSAALARELLFSSSFSRTDREQFDADMAFVASIQGSHSTRLNQLVFGNGDEGKLSGEAYLKFFLSRIASLEMVRATDGITVAYVAPFADPHQMFLTGNYVNFKIPQIVRFSYVLHESRHSETEKGGWHHTLCPGVDATGKPIIGIHSGNNLKGLPGCDIAYEGGYGVQTIMLMNVARNCESCTDKVRQDAEIFGDSFARRIVDPESYSVLVSDFSGERK